jgi:hypothetical protein
MKTIRAVLYFIWIVVAVPFRRKPAGLEIAIGRFQQLYAQGFIKGLTYTKDDWLLVELQDEFLQQNRIQAEFRSAGKNQKTDQRFFAKMISMEYLNELLAEVKKDYPNAKEVFIHQIN